MELYVSRDGPRHNTDDRCPRCNVEVGKHGRADAAQHQQRLSDVANIMTPRNPAFVECYCARDTEPHVELRMHGRVMVVDDTPVLIVIVVRSYPASRWHRGSGVSGAIQRLIDNQVAALAVPRVGKAAKSRLTGLRLTASGVCQDECPLLHPIHEDSASTSWPLFSARLALQNRHRHGAQWEHSLLHCRLPPSLPRLSS